MDNLYEMIKKADSGDVEAQYEVAKYIIFGDFHEDVEPDWAERAIHYFKSAAARGNSNAMCYLGATYNVGRGVKPDIYEAIYWWRQSASLLNKYAYRPLSSYDGKEPDGSYGKKCFNYLFKGAILGNAECISEIGAMFFDGEFLDADQRLAFKLYRVSYNTIEDNADDYGEICLRLGMCYNDGTGVEQDLVKAKFFFTKTIEIEESKIASGICEHYFIGSLNRAKLFLKRLNIGKPLIEEKIVNSIEQTAEELFELGLNCFENELDYENAFKYFAKCILTKIVSKSSYGDELLYLARMYREGLYIKTDERFSEFLNTLNKRTEVLNG